MSPWEEVERAVAVALADGVTPSVDLVVCQGGERLLHLREGLAQRVPVERPLSQSPSWDLASLTKPLVGAAVCYALIDQGALSFGTLARRVVPEAAEHVTVAQLLSHSSGYPAWRPLYERVDGAGLAWGSPAARRLVLRAAAETPLEAPPGERGCYSDVGFLVLCDLLERVGGDRVDRLWRELVAGPAGLRGLRWGGGDVATEDCPRRGGVVVGAVHDLNCASMGGVSSHAGLFGDALAVADAGAAFLDASHGRGPLAGDAIRWAWTHRGRGSHWMGWDGRSAGGSSSGAHFPDDAVGHLGFTGTSIWMSPGRELVVALLTNRVHPSIDDVRIRAFRPQIHDAVVSGLRALGRW